MIYAIKYFCYGIKLLNIPVKNSYIYISYMSRIYAWVHISNYICLKHIWNIQGLTCIGNIYATKDIYASNIYIMYVINIYGTYKIIYASNIYGTYKDSYMLLV